ncbi:phage tail tip lysozyme [Paraburkholderia humisilvae]
MQLAQQFIQQGAGTLKTQAAAGDLASYMTQDNIGTLDPNQLYALANNPPSGTPPGVSAAAAYMLKNSSAYEQIETHDSSGADGLSGVGNFQWASEGGLSSASPFQMGSGSGFGGMSPFGGMPSMGGITAFGGMPSMGGMTSFGGMPSMGGMTSFGGMSSMGGMSSLGDMSSFGDMSSLFGSDPLEAQAAAGALASYMSQNNIGALDPNALYQLANNPPPNMPPGVSEAANYMLENPDIYEQIETHDVAGADGISGIGNFQWAAEGGLMAGPAVSGSGGLPADGGSGTDDPAENAPPANPSSSSGSTSGSSGGGTSSSTGGSTSGSKGSDSTVPNISTSDPAKAIAEDLEQRYGLTATQAAGVLGNLQQESGLQGDVNQGGATGAPSSNDADDNGHGWGLAQWGGTRKQGEIDYANEHGLDPGSLQANIGFMNQELDGAYSKTITDIKKTNNVSDAAKVWDEDYEEATDPQMGNRVQYAQNFLDEGL